MIDLTVKTLDSQNHAFSLEDDQITVRGFKEHIAESVAVPADSQRLIYCGRVLQDEKKLNDYDVNGKVIHLVQRAPPQPGQRGSDGAQNQGQNNGQAWMNEPGTHYRFTRTQMHGNAMYLGAMSVPAEIVEARAVPIQQLSNTLVSSRLRLVRQMFTRIQDVLDRLADPNRPPNPPAPENNQSSSAEQEPIETGQQVPEVETVHEHIFSNNDGGLNGGTTLAEAAAFAIAAALSAAGANNFTVLRGNSDEEGEAGPPSDGNDDNQPDAEQQQPQQQSEQQESTSTNDGQSNRRSTPQQPLNLVMAELLEILLSTQRRMRPYLQRYIDLMYADPPLTAGSGPGGVEECQRVVDSLSESLHLMSHACHSLSDVIVNMDQEPPRQLRCRPLLLQHSAILHPGVPIQVEATISLHPRNANNNNSGEGASDFSSAQSSSQSESPELNTDDTNQQEESGRTAQQQTEQQQSQSPFGIVFNLPNNVDVEMEVSPDGNIEVASGSEQTQSSENNNNNNNAGRMGGASSGGSPLTWWDTHLPPSMLRHLMRSVLTGRPQGGVATTTITTPNAPPAAGQQSVVTSLDSGTTNAGQSTQARSNVGTHPTTATQTRSTSRPHVFHQHAHPLGLGASVGDGHNFDIFLPCNSHHIRRMPAAASNTVTLMSQGTRSGQTSAPETQTQTQSQPQSQPQPQSQSQSQTQTQSPTAPSTTSSGGNTTNTTASATSQRNRNRPFAALSRQIFGRARYPSQEPSTTTSGGSTTNSTASVTSQTYDNTPFSDLSQYILGGLLYPSQGPSTTSSGGSTTNTTASVTSQTNDNRAFSNLSQQIFGNAVNSSQAFDPARRPGHIMQMFGGGNIFVGFLEDRNGTSIGNLTWAELLALRGITMDLFTSQGSENEENFLVNLCAIVIQNITVEGLIRLRIGQTDPIARLRNPLREFFQNSFPNTTPDVLQEQAADRLLSQLRVYIQKLRTVEEEGTRRSGPRIDICATVESLLRRHIKDALQFLFNNDVDDAGFGQEMLNIVKRLSEQLYTVLRYSVRGGQAGLGPVTQRFETYILADIHPIFHQMINGFFDQSRYFSHLPQPPDSEIVPLLIYKDVPSEAPATPSAPAHPPVQPLPDTQPMETEVVEERRSTFEATLPDDGEEIPKTFPGHETLPSDWVPIIARDGVRQRRQLQMQGMANSGVTTFSDAYIGTLPYKRRKLIERQKPRLLVSPPPNHSAIAASMERLVREGVTRAGIEEVDGAAVAVAGDPGVRRAFGQAIRDCLNPRRYETPDFPDPLRFPNATKYFADQERPPK